MQLGVVVVDSLAIKNSQTGLEHF